MSPRVSDLFADDPDIGMCDYCQSEDGRRHRVVTDDHEIAGRRRAIAVWLCDACWQDEMSRR